MVIDYEKIPQQYRELTKQNPPACIYAQQTRDGKTYVGQTNASFTARIRRHLSDLEKGKHCNKQIQADFSASLEPVISFVLEICEPNQLDAKERAWIAYFRSQGTSYNILQGGSKRDEYRALKHSRAKTWQLLDKCDTIITFTNYFRWCALNNISHGVYNVLSGKQPHCAGYRHISELGKTYTLMDDKGQLVEIDNVVTFAESRGLCASLLYRVIRGKQYGYAGYSNLDNPRPVKPVVAPKVIYTPEQRAEKARQHAKAYYHANSKKINKAVWQRRKNRPDRLEYRKKYKKRESVKIKARIYEQAYNLKIRTMKKLTDKAYRLRLANAIRSWKRSNLAYYQQYRARHTVKGNVSPS